MEKWKRTRFILVLVLPFCLTFSSLAQGKESTEISSNFLKGPIVLAKLWQSTPDITSSSLINPGVPVRLANGVDLPKQESPKPVAEEKPKEMPKEPEIKKVEPPPVGKKFEEKAEIKAVEEKPKAAEAKPKTVEEAAKAVEEKPKEVAKKENFFLDLRSAGFFSDIDYRGIGIIVDSKESKTLMGEGDIAYLTFTASEPVSIGNKYTVFRASDLVDHPITGKKIGRRYNIIGNIQIIDRYGRFYVARVMEVFDSMSKGDFIRPYFKEIMEVEQGKK